MRPRATEGFTLLEVLVAVFIMALVLSFAFQAYQGIAESYARVSAVSSRDRAAHILVDRLERELVGAVMIEREKGADPLLHPFLFFAEPRSYGESTGFDLRFITQTPLRSPGSPPAALALVTYGTAPAKSGQGFDLLRQEEPLPTQLEKEIDWTGAQTVAEDVADFRLGFSVAAGQDSVGWDSTSPAHLDDLPQYVEVSVALWETGPDGQPWPGLPVMRQVNLLVRPFRLAPEGANEGKCGGGVTVATCLAGFADQIAHASPSLAAAINDAGAQAKEVCWSEAPPPPALERLRSLMDGLHGFDPGKCQ